MYGIVLMLPPGGKGLEAVFICLECGIYSCPRDTDPELQITAICTGEVTNKASRSSFICIFDQLRCIKGEPFQVVKALCVSAPRLEMQSLWILR